MNKFIMLSCPWCGAAMGPQQIGRSTKCMGYRKLAHPARIRLICEDPDCDFSSGDGLPLAVIDEQIYEVATYAFRLAPWTSSPCSHSSRLPDVCSVLARPSPPPELIIQDELHLISGPLGSMVGHYETVDRRPLHVMKERTHGYSRKNHRIDCDDLPCREPGEGDFTAAPPFCFRRRL